jgi:Tol biopolymer transport system component
MKMQRPILALACLIAASTPDECPGVEPKGSWITFLSARSGNTLLYKMRPDGSQLTPVFGGEIEGVAGIPEGATYYRQPHFGYQSPDGKYFLDWALDMATRGGKIVSAVKMLHLGRLDGGTTRIIAAEGVTECFAWAPDSKRFVFETTNQVRSITGKMISTPNRS